MSQDNADDLLPSGYNATPPAVGETDIGVPVFHEALWLALSDLRDVDSGAYIGLAYRLMWGSLDGGEGPQLEGEHVGPVGLELAQSLDDIGGSSDLDVLIVGLQVVNDVESAQRLAQ